MFCFIRVLDFVTTHLVLGLHPVCVWRCRVSPAYLGRGVRARVLPLIQLVPALHQFNNDWPAEVHQLETSHIGPAMHEPLQRYVLKTLRQGEKDRKTER